MNKAEVDHKIIHVITLQPISWLYFFFPLHFTSLQHLIVYHSLLDICGLVLQNNEFYLPVC